MPEAWNRQRRAAKDIIKPIGTYDTQGKGPSKASRQRHKRACMDLCCPRPWTIEGEPPKEKKKGLYGLMLPKAKDRRRQVAKGIREPIGTYVGRGLGPSKVSHQRHRRSYKDLCCLRSKAIEGDPPKA